MRRPPQSAAPSVAASSRATCSPFVVGMPTPTSTEVMLMAGNGVIGGASRRSTSWPCCCILRDGQVGKASSSPASIGNSECGSSGRCAPPSCRASSAHPGAGAANRHQSNLGPIRPPRPWYTDGRQHEQARFRHLPGLRAKKPASRSARTGRPTRHTHRTPMLSRQVICRAISKMADCLEMARRREKVRGIERAPDRWHQVTLPVVQVGFMMRGSSPGRPPINMPVVLPDHDSKITPEP